MSDLEILIKNLRTSLNSAGFPTELEDEAATALESLQWKLECEATEARKKIEVLQAENERLQKVWK